MKSVVALVVVASLPCAGCSATRSLSAPRCGDALRVLALITDPKVTADILEHLGLTSDPVPIAPARGPPEDPGYELDFGS